MSDDNSSKPPVHRRKNILSVILLLFVAVGALGYSASRSGLMDMIFPAGEDKLPQVDFEELHDRIKKPEDLAYVKSIEEATVSEYDRLNPRDSDWYQDGRMAAKLFAFVVARGDVYGEGLLALAADYAHRAWNKACRDPLILSVCDVHNFRFRHSTASKDGLRHVTDARLMLKSNYPAICKLETASVMMKNFLWMKRVKKPVDDLSSVIAMAPIFLGEALDTFAELVKTTPPESILYWKSEMFTDDIDKNTEFLTIAGKRIDEVLAASNASGALRAYCRGNTLINLAWAARGTGWANSVTPEGWQVMVQRLSEARAELTAGAAAFPKEKRLPTLMITVELGENGTIAEMNNWFEEAVAIDPDYGRPYSRKMYFLQPKWHGSPRAVVDFGRECLATGQWEACIPMVLVDGLDELSTQYEHLYDDAAVWKLLSETNEEFLRRYPKSVVYRTKYFDAAVQAKQWKIARAQLKILGNRWDRAAFNEKEFNELKAAIPAES